MELLQDLGKFVKFLSVKVQLAQLNPYKKLPTIKWLAIDVINAYSTTGADLNTCKPTQGRVKMLLCRFNFTDFQWHQWHQGHRTQDTGHRTQDTGHSLHGSHKKFRPVKKKVNHPRAFKKIDIMYSTASYLRVCFKPQPVVFGVFECHQRRLVELLQQSHILGGGDVV